MRALIFFNVLLISTAAMDGYANESLPLVRGEALYTARERLIALGWLPRQTDVRMEDGTLERTWGDAKSFVNAGVIEVQSCSGMDRNYCFFNYQRAADCLSVETEGEYRKDGVSPIVYRWKILRCK